MPDESVFGDSLKRFVKNAYLTVAFTFEIANSGTSAVALASPGASGYHQHTRLGEKDRSVYAAAWGDAHAAAA
jgi:hypothetical protein